MLTETPTGQSGSFPVYDPEKFKLFCHNHGAPHLFNFVSACMTSSHHTRVRKQLNDKRTVAVILQLCFGLSQKCSFFQADNGILLRFSHCTNQGLNTQRVIGTSTCSMTELLSKLFRNFHLLMKPMSLVLWMMLLKIENCYY